MTRYFVAIV